MRKLSAKVEQIGKAGHEGADYTALAAGYSIARNTVAKHVERYRRAHGLATPKKYNNDSSGRKDTDR